MVSLRFWQSAHAFTGAAMVMTIASSLLVPVAAAIAQTSIPTPPPPSFPTRTSPAQTFPDTWRRSAVPTGTLIPLRYDKAERIILKKDETLPVTLTVTRDVLTARGTVLIPTGSQIEGKFQPVEGGTQFFAENVILQNNRSAIDATSSPITKTETISRRSNPDILRGAAIGGGAAAVLAEIFGKINPLEVIGGAGLGVLAEVLLRGRQEVEVVVVEPETDIDLRLRSDFSLN
ncbi:MAG: hypothetical protein KME15_02485 [Drouetiella hepatica Uher 2000/2452]|jgi:hypothetical protein|uniref:Conjugal transfer protein TrbI n=1 Tax=Drouetiella hepatica Uher 2000/2452 TaxID=904376 RepID=A0A951UKF6_9CYAN|nr:hypothetical protein [Drouetiella hepatica Uher 2000/2452]